MNDSIWKRHTICFRKATTKIKIQKFSQQKLPSLSYATSDGRGPHRPAFTGVGDGDPSRAKTSGRSYSLVYGSNGDTEAARMSRGGTLNARASDGLRNGGTLVARGTLKPRGTLRPRDGER